MQFTFLLMLNKFSQDVNFIIIFLTLLAYGLTFQNLSKSAYWQNGYQYVWTF